jgi:23S rRNA pseudouridine1911/1915/1917 synthase
MTGIDVLFCDDAVVIVDKPPGVPSDVTPDPNRPHLRSIVAAQLGVDPDSLIVVHRLDRDTTGVIVLARSREAGAHLAEQFRSRLTQKTYVAICGVLPSSVARAGTSFTVDNHLRSAAGGRGRVEIVRAGGDRAITHVKVLERLGNGALVEATPHTGRTHQIRVHLASVGLPIVGDPVYAPPGIAAFATRTMLHARALRLAHPVTGEALDFEARLPDDLLDCAEQLREGAAFRSVPRSGEARRPANTPGGNRRR